MSFTKRLNDTVVSLVNVEHRIDPYFRDTFDALFQKPLSWIVQALINLLRTKDQLAIAEERSLPNEPEITEAIIQSMCEFLRQTYQPGFAQRAGNTKTYGVVRGEFTVLPDLAEDLRVGIFAVPKTYRAWVRFGGPGPFAPPDLKDNGGANGPGPPNRTHAR